MAASSRCIGKKAHDAKAVCVPTNGGINYSNLFYFILWAKILFYYLNFKWICKNEIFISSASAARRLAINQFQSNNRIEPDATNLRNNKKKFNHFVMSNISKHISPVHVHGLMYSWALFFVRAENDFFPTVRTFSIAFCIFPICVHELSGFSCEWWALCGNFRPQCPDVIPPESSHSAPVKIHFSIKSAIGA